MEEPTANVSQLAASFKKVARHFFTIGENRLELLKVELQEERERLLQDILLALGAAAFGLLACLTLTAAVVVYFWQSSPMGVLFALTLLYGGAGFGLWNCLTKRLANWQMLSSTFDELRKDKGSMGKDLQ